MYKRIVAGTDLSDTSLIACRRASALGQVLGADLELVYVGSDPGSVLRDTAESMGGKAVVRRGNAAEQLVAAAEGTDTLLVVGSVGMRGAKRFLLGSVPNKVSHHAATDLLIVKTDPPWSDGDAYEKILVGTDGSGTSMRAVDAAATFAASLGVGATIVSAYDPPSEKELSAMRRDPNDPIAQWNSRTVGDTPAEFRWRIADASQARDVIERAEEHAARHGADVETRAEKGSAVEVLLDIAESEGFDLIVVGSVGMSGTKRFMLGNVPNRISHHAPTDVLILQTA